MSNVDSRLNKNLRNAKQGIKKAVEWMDQTKVGQKAVNVATALFEQETYRNRIEGQKLDKLYKDSDQLLFASADKTNALIREKIQAEVQTKTPELEKAIQNGMNMGKYIGTYTNELFNQYSQDTQQERQNLDPETRKYYRNFNEYSLQRNLQMLKELGVDNLHENEDVRNYIALRTNVEKQMGKSSVTEMIGNTGRALASPYYMTAGTLLFRAGKEGSYMERAGKQILSSGFMDPEAQNISRDESIFFDRYLTSRWGGFFDFVPVAGRGVDLTKNLIRAKKYGKTLEQASNYGINKLKQLDNDQFNNLFVNNKFLTDLNNGKKITTIEEAFNVIQKNPGAYQQVAKRAKKSGVTGLEEVFDSASYASALGRGEGLSLKNATLTPIKDFYLMTNDSYKFMATMGGLGLGIETAGRVLDSKTVQTLSGIAMDPVSTAVKLLGVGYNQALEDTYKQFASGYGLNIDQLKGLDDSDPLKAKIKESADLLYRSYTVTNLLGYKPSTRYGKLLGAMGDTGISYAGLRYGTMPAIRYGTQAAKLDNFFQAYKDGYANIDSIREIEKAMEMAPTSKEKVEVFNRLVDNLDLVVRDGSIGDAIKASKLFRDGFEGLRSNIAEVMSNSEMNQLKLIENKMNESIKFLAESFNIDSKAGENKEARVQARQALGEAARELNDFIDRSQILHGDSGLAEDVLRNQLYVESGIKALNTIKQGIGFKNTIARIAAKIGAKTVDDPVLAFFRDEVNPQLIKETEQMTSLAKTIVSTFKFENTKLDLMKKMWKTKDGESFVNREIDEAIDIKLDSMLQDLPTNIINEVRGIIKSGVYKALFDSMQLKYTGAEGEIQKLSNEFLATMISGKDLTNEMKKTSLGKALIKPMDTIEVLKTNLIEGAKRFSEEINRKTFEGLDDLQKDQLSYLTNVMESIRGISDGQRAIKVYMDMQSAMKIFAAPDTFKDFVGDIKNSQEVLEFMLSKVSTDSPAYQGLKQWLVESKDKIEQNNVRDEFDTGMFIDHIQQSSAKFSQQLQKDIDEIEIVKGKNAEVIEVKTQLDEIVNGINGLPEEMTALQVAYKPAIRKIQETIVELNYQKELEQLKNELENKSIDDMKIDIIDTDELIKGIANRIDEAGSMLTRVEPADVDFGVNYYVNKSKTEGMTKEMFLIEVLKDAGFRSNNPELLREIQLQKEMLELPESMLLENLGSDAAVRSYITETQKTINDLENAGLVDTIQTSLADRRADNYIGKNLFELSKKFDLYKDGIDTTSKTILYDDKGERIENTTTTPSYEFESTGLKNLTSDGFIGIDDINIVKVDHNLILNHKKPENAQKDYINLHTKLREDIQQKTDSTLINITDSEPSYYSIPNSKLNEQIESFSPGLLKAWAGKERQLREYFAIVKLAGIDKDPRINKRTGTTDFLTEKFRTVDENYFLELVNNTQKYMSKIVGGNARVVNGSEFRNLVFKEPKSMTNPPKLVDAKNWRDIEHQDGEIFLFNKGLDVYSQKKFLPDQSSSIKIQFNGNGFGVKGMGFDGNISRIESLLIDPDNYKLAEDYLKQVTGLSNLTFRNTNELARKLAENIDTLIMESAVKDYNKGLSKAGTIEKIRDFDSSQGEWVSYDIAGETPRNKTVTLNWQYIQHIVGERGDAIAEGLNRYIESNKNLPYHTVKEMIELIKEGKYVELNEVMLNKIESVLESGGLKDQMIAKTGNILDLKGVKIQNLLANAITNNILSKKIEGERMILGGLPTVVDYFMKTNPDIQKTYGDLSDGNYVILSRAHAGVVSKGEKREYMMIGRYPITGPKSTAGVKAIYIENLPKNIRSYFLDRNNKPVHEMYITPELKQKKEADYDADESNIFHNFSRVTTPDGTKTMGELLYEYTKEIDGYESSRQATEKANISDYKNIIPEAELKQKGVGAIFAIRNFSKENTKYTSAMAKAMSIMDFYPNKLSDKDKIIYKNKFANYIQAAVDGNLKGQFTDVYKTIDELAAKMGIPKDVMRDQLSTKKSWMAFTDSRLKEKDKGPLDSLYERVATTKSIKDDLNLNFGNKNWFDGFDMTKDNIKKFFQETQNMRRLQNAVIIEGLGFNKMEILNDIYNFSTNKIKKLGSGIFTKANELNYSKSKEFKQWLDSVEEVNPDLHYRTSLYLMSINVPVNIEASLSKQAIRDYSEMEQTLMGKNGGGLSLIQEWNTKGLLDINYWNEVIKRSKDRAASEGKKLFIPGQYDLRDQVAAMLFHGKMNELEGMLNRMGITKEDMALKGVENNNWEQAIREEHKDHVKTISLGEPVSKIESDSYIKRDVIKEVNSLIEKEIQILRENMHEKGMEPKLEGTTIKLIDDILIKGNPSIEDLKNIFPNRVIDTIQAKHNVDGDTVLKMVKDIFTGIKDTGNGLIPKDLSEFKIKADVINSNQKEINQMNKEYNKNLKMLSNDMLDKMNATLGEKFHRDVSEAYAQVRKTIQNDPLFRETYIKELEKVYEKNRSLNINDANEIAIKNTWENLRTDKLNEKTEEKIDGIMRTVSEGFGKHISDFVVDKAKQTKELARLSNNDMQFDSMLKEHMMNALLKERASEGSVYNWLNQTIQAMGNVFKVTTLGPALGRAITEYANTYFIKNQKYQDAQRAGGVHNKETFMYSLGVDKLELDYQNKAGDYTHSEMFGKRGDKLSGLYKDSPLEDKFLSKISNTLFTGMEKVSRVSYGMAVKTQMPRIYEIEYFKALNNTIRNDVDLGKNPQEFYQKIFTTKDSELDGKERRTKLNILRKADRIASKELKESIYDYANNPLFLSEAEHYLPYANFLYTSAKLMSKNPLHWLTIMNFANNAYNSFENVEFDLDGDELRGYVYTNRIGMQMTGLFGFAGGMLDFKRLLPIDGTNISPFRYPYQKLFFPTQDRDYKRLLTDDKFHWYDYTLKKIAPTVSDIVLGMSGRDEKAGASRLFYLFTGMGVRDQSKFKMLQSYYKQDYDTLLQQGNVAWSEFNQWRRMNGYPELSKNDIIAKKYFDELMFTGMDPKVQLYINVLSDHMFKENVLDPMGFSKDINAAKEIRNAMKGIITDISTGFLWGNSEGANLLQKVNELNSLTVKNGQVVPRGEKDKSLLEHMRSVGTMDDFLTRLEWYAENQDVLENYQRSNTRYFKFNQKNPEDNGTPQDVARVSAFRYTFQEELEDPKRSRLREQDYKAYLVEKEAAILNGTLRNALIVQDNTRMSSTYQLTPEYEKYLLLGKGKMVTDMEGSLSKVRTYGLMRNLMYKYAFDPNKSNEKQYYFDQAKAYEQKMQDEEHFLWLQIPESFDYMNIKKATSALNAEIRENELYKWEDKMAAFAEGHRLVIANQNKKQKKSKISFLENIKKNPIQLQQRENKNGISIEDAIEMFR